MEKILKVALQNCKPSLDAVMTVINSTPNPAIAAEVLLGIYEAPHINKGSDKLESRYHDPQFESFNPISQTVFYTYEETDAVDGWFLKDETEHTSENLVAIGWNSEIGFNDYKKRYPEVQITIDEFKKNFKQRTCVVGLTGKILTGSTSLRNWQ